MFIESSVCWQCSQTAGNSCYITAFELLGTADR